MKGAEAIPSSLRLNAVTRADRLAATAAVREMIVATCHGWIGDFYQYSNTSLCLHFEMPTEYLSLLRDALRDALVNLSGESQEAIRGQLTAGGKSEVIVCTLQIAFIHNQPDLRRHVPAVPG
jgi:hypothetical protein